MRLVVLIFFILLCTVVPFPINFNRKDKLPTYTIEQIDEKQDDEDTDDTYEVL